MTGQDRLRDEIAVIIREHIFGNDTPSDEADCCADAVLPVVQCHIDAAREQAEADTAAHIAHYVEQAAAARDAAVARAEQAEQAVARVRDAIATHRISFQPGAVIQINHIEDALDGTP